MMMMMMMPTEWSLVAKKVDDRLLGSDRAAVQGEAISVAVIIEGDPIVAAHPDVMPIARRIEDDTVKITGEIAEMTDIENENDVISLTLFIVVG